LRSAAFDGELGLIGEPANARPAFGLHLAEVFHAGHIGSSVGSSSFCGLLAHGVGLSEVIDASDLFGLGALIGSDEADKECEQGGNQDGFHSRFLMIISSNLNSIYTIQVV
jgi:hypothetical protein